MRFWLPLALLACGPQQPEPDISYAITVTGVSTDCTTDPTGYATDVFYDLYFDGHVVAVFSKSEEKNQGVQLASGSVTGCTILYETPVWLEDRGTSADGESLYIRWTLEGKAKYQGAAGGCVENGLDWEGTETITVTESTDPDVPTGCTYEMSTSGTLME